MLLVVPTLLFVLAMPLIDLPGPYLLLAAMPCGINSHDRRPTRTASTCGSPRRPSPGRRRSRSLPPASRRSSLEPPGRSRLTRCFITSRSRSGPTRRPSSRCGADRLRGSRPASRAGRAASSGCSAPGTQIQSRAQRDARWPPRDSRTSQSSPPSSTRWSAALRDAGFGWRRPRTRAALARTRTRRRGAGRPSGRADPGAARAERLERAPGRSVVRLVAEQAVDARGADLVARARVGACATCQRELAPKRTGSCRRPCQRHRAPRARRAPPDPAVEALRACR